MSNKLPFLTRVQLRNYRSIAACDVNLGPLTFLVGPNGSGKSNFLDALRLVPDALNQTLEHALRERGGIGEVRRRSSGHPTHFGMRFDFRLANGQSGSYAFEVGAGPGGAFAVKTEVCAVPGAQFRVAAGRVVGHSELNPPVASEDRLYLVTCSGLPPFRPVYDALSRMGFYNLNPALLRNLQQPDKGDILKRDGANLPSVLGRMSATNPSAKQRIEEYLSKVVEGVEGVDSIQVAHMETLEFRQRVQGAGRPWRFPANNMSDGTLRALGILVALFQEPERGGVPLVGIEEPEIALHPGAAGVLRDALNEASRTSQVIVTSHSPDLLDDPRLSGDSILGVVMEAGTTQIGPLDEASRSVLRDQLYTAGELLRADQLRPDPASYGSRLQLRLFEEDEK